MSSEVLPKPIKKRTLAEVSYESFGGTKFSLDSGSGGSVQMLMGGGNLDLLMIGKEIPSNVTVKMNWRVGAGNCGDAGVTCGDVLSLQDLNPGWPDHARSTLADLARRLDHAL